MAEQTDRQFAAAALKRSSVRRWRLFDVEEVSHRQIGQEWAPHWHDEWSVGVIINGICDCQVGGEPWHLRSGTVLRIAPQVVHTGALLPKANSQAVEVLMWYLPNSWLQQQGFFWQAQSQFQFNPALANAAAKLSSSMADPSAFKAWLTQIDAELTTTNAMSTASQAAPVPSSVQQILREVQQLVVDGHCTVSDAARTCGISREQLHRHIKRWTGMAPQQYFRVVRLNRARSMLLHGESISDTAHVCGFADQAHFSRWFRRSFGYSPGDLLNASK